jgi:hypothetical protein
LCLRDRRRRDGSDRSADCRFFEEGTTFHIVVS